MTTKGCSSAARMVVSKTTDRGSNPCAPAIGIMEVTMKKNEGLTRVEGAAVLALLVFMLQSLTGDADTAYLDAALTREEVFRTLRTVQDTVEGLLQEIHDHTDEKL